MIVEKIFYCPHCGNVLEESSCSINPEDGNCWYCPKCDFATDDPWKDAIVKEVIKK